MYAIQNVKTGKFLCGTDYRYGAADKSHHQITSKNEMITYADYYRAAQDFLRRRCGKDYRIVVLKTVEVKRIIDFDMDNRYMTYWERQNCQKSGGLNVEE